MDGLKVDGDGDGVGVVDRLSSLPDDLLSKILGFLCIHHAAQTHGLAKRWRHLWSFGRELCFFVKEDWAYPYHHSPQYVEDVIAHYKGPKVPSFSLCIEGDVVRSKQVDSWIGFAIDRNAGDLSLSFLESERLYKLPPQLFCGSSLTFLYLESFELDVTGSVCLGSLKDLRLRQVVFSRASLEKFTSGSPVLRDVDMMDCNPHSVLYIYITNPSVECVSVRDGRDYDYSAGDAGLLKIYAPSLSSLELGGVMRPKYILRNVSSLVGASLDFKCNNDGDVLLLKELLGSLTSCVSLFLSGWCVQVLSLSMINREFFSTLNLTTLQVNLPLFKCELLGLTRLVEITPNLESLSIHFGFWNEEVDETPSLWSFFSGVEFSDFFLSEFMNTEWDETHTGEENNIEEGAWDLMEECFSGKLLKLTKVKLENFCGLGFLGGGYPKSGSQPFTDICNREAKLAAFLLKHSPVLEEMVVCFPKVCYSKMIINGIVQGMESITKASSKVKLSYELNVVTTYLYPI